jgi:hypothetical protein
VKLRQLNMYRPGHAQERLRETFADAIAAYRDWEGEREPYVRIGNGLMLISMVCGKCWNLSDQLPRDLAEDIEAISGSLEWKSKSRTYASAARHLKTLITSEKRKLQEKEFRRSSADLRKTGEFISRFSRGHRP